MKTKILSLLVAMLLAGAAHASPRFRVYAAADGGDVPETGVSADALNGGVTSDTINIGEDWPGSTLTWQAVVTPGTTTDVQATCEESADGTVWVKIMHCSDSATSTCLEQKLSYDVTTTPAFSLLIEKVRAQYMRCSFEDLASGNGTISASAVVGSP